MAEPGREVGARAAVSEKMTQKNKVSVMVSCPCLYRPTRQHYSYCTVTRYILTASVFRRICLWSRAVVLVPPPMPRTEWSSKPPHEPTPTRTAGLEWYSRFTSRSSGASLHRSTNRCFVLDEPLLYGPRLVVRVLRIRTNERPKTTNQVIHHLQNAGTA